KIRKSTTPATTAGSGVKFGEKLLYLESIKANPTKALCRNPNFRSAPISTITQCLSSMGIDLAAARRILDIYPQLLTADPYTGVNPIFHFLRSPKIGYSCALEYSFEAHIGVPGRIRLLRPKLTDISNAESSPIPETEFFVGLGFE
ncbi:Mitochondrial transcription termination factor family protein, partial [Striga hermonthica]